jgi:hypothetical protein
MQLVGSTEYITDMVFMKEKHSYSWSLEPIILKIGLSLGGLWGIDIPWVFVT